MARRFMGKTQNFTGEKFWARGYFVSTVGLDEEVVRAYIREQEKEEGRYEQLASKSLDLKNQLSGGSVQF